MFIAVSFIIVIIGLVFIQLSSKVHHKMENLVNNPNLNLSNFRFVQGKHVNSVVWVSGQYGYHSEHGRITQKSYDPDFVYYLRCKKNQKQGCPGRARVFNHTLTVKTPHNCDSTEEEWITKEAKEEMKQRSRVEATGLKVSNFLSHECYNDELIQYSMHLKKISNTYSISSLWHTCTLFSVSTKS